MIILSLVKERVNRYQPNIWWDGPVFTGFSGLCAGRFMPATLLLHNFVTR